MNAWLQTCFDTMELHDWAAIFIVCAIAYSMYRAHQNQAMRHFNIFDLLMENGRVSKVSCFFAATWVILTWIMVKITLKGTMTEGFFMSYGGLFVAPLLARMLADAQQKQPVPPTPPPSQVSITQITQPAAPTEEPHEHRKS